MVPAGVVCLAGAGLCGVLDRRDVELEVDLVRDEHAAGVQGGVEADAVVAAVQDGRALVSRAHVAVRVGRQAGEVEGDGDGLGDVLDAQVAGHGELSVVELLDRGALEGDLREGRGVEEVVGAQVAVSLLVAGVDAGDVDADLRGGRGRVGGVEVDRGGGGGGSGADLGDHRVAGHEADAAVAGVDGVVAGQGVGNGGGGHRGCLLSAAYFA